MKAKFKNGTEVVVYDRYRFAIPLIGFVTRSSQVNDGVEIELLQSNNNSYPIGSKVWVHSAQLKRSKKIKK